MLPATARTAEHVEVDASVMSHLDSRRATRMDCHNGEWIRDVWATATEVQIDPSKVNGPGRDMWDAILARWNKETVDKGGLSSVG